MQVAGFCPTLGRNYSIDIDYLPSQTLNGVSTYVKDRYECDCASYGNACIAEKCPLYESAPEYKR